MSGDDLKPNNQHPTGRREGHDSDAHSAEPLRKQEEIPSAHFVYLVQCSNGAFYTGYTTNVDKRIAAHNAGKGAKYTRAHLPVTLLACWSFSSKGEALRAEHAIKHLSRAQKVRLIEHALQGSLVLPDCVNFDRKRIFCDFGVG